MMSFPDRFFLSFRLQFSCSLFLFIFFLPSFFCQFFQRRRPPFLITSSPLHPLLSSPCEEGERRRGGEVNEELFSVTLSLSRRKAAAASVKETKTSCGENLQLLAVG